MTIAHNQIGPCIERERFLPSELVGISPLVDRLMILLNKCGCVPQGESDVEIALRELSETRSFMEITRIPEQRVYIGCCREPDGVSITVKDEGKGFDISKMSDPTAPQNIASVHGRGIYLRWALIDEVRFEEGGLSFTKERPGRDQQRAEVLARSRLTVRNPYRDL